LIGEGRTPGLQYLFLSANEVLFSYSGGKANLIDGHPVTERTTFNAYSVTKIFTAAAILRMAEQNRLGLDEPIAQYLNHFPYAQSPTVRETLSHTGGFPNPIPLAWVHLAEEHATFDTAGFVIGVLARNTKLKSTPGQTYAYSNIGYLLLGEVIEKVTGQPYAEFIEQTLIRPLRLSEGETLAFNIKHQDMHAHGYLKRWSFMNAALGHFIDRDRYIDARTGRWVQFRNHYVNGTAYGGLIGSGRGFARYLQALLDKSNYLTEPTRSLLFAPARTRDGSLLPRTLGWFTGRLNGEAYYTHAGGGAGYYCEIRLYPNLGRASVIMLNRTGIRDERILDRIDAFFLAHGNVAR
jgi:D-alanyl-D-alanine carboxypeptidase